MRYFFLWALKSFYDNFFIWSHEHFFSNFLSFLSMWCVRELWMSLDHINSNVSHIPWILNQLCQHVYSSYEIGYPMRMNFMRVEVKMYKMSSLCQFYWFIIYAKYVVFLNFLHSNNLCPNLFLIQLKFDSLFVIFFSLSNGRNW